MLFAINRYQIKFIGTVLSFVLIMPIAASNNESDNKLTTVEQVVLGTVLGLGITAIVIVASPYVLSAGTIVGLKSAGAVATAKISAAGATVKGAVVAAAPTIKAAAPVVQVVTTTVNGVKLIKGFIVTTPEQKIEMLISEDQAFDLEKALKAVVAEQENFRKNNISSKI